MRIVFMGTPAFAVPSLEAMMRAGHNVVAVCTQPDRPVGRKRQLLPTPVKAAAAAHGIPALQFEKLRRREGREALEALHPDLFVTAAFGQILSPRLLRIPPLGTVNVHASLLPAYRGPAPIQWALYQGERVTGVTTMFTDAGIDTGAMLLQAETAIDPNENAEALSERLSRLGASLLLDTLAALEAGTLRPTPQDEAAASYFPILTKETGWMDFTRPCEALHNQVRALQPWPVAGFSLDGLPFKVFRAEALPGINGAPGQILSADPKNGLCIACGHGALRIRELQAPGGKRMEAEAYLRGKPLAATHVAVSPTPVEPQP